MAAAAVDALSHTNPEVPPPLPSRPPAALYARIRPPTAETHPVISQWRSWIPAKSKPNMTSSTTDSEEGLSTFSVVVPDQSKWITSLVASADKPLVALSSASEDHNIFIVRYNIPPGANSSFASDREDSYGQFFDLETTYSCNHPVYDLSWQQNHLLASCGNSSVELIRFEDGSLSQVNRYVLTAQEKSVYPSPPGQYISSSRIHAVDFQPVPQSHSFLAIESCNLRIWNMNVTQAPVASCKVSNQPNLAAVWSPHYSSGVHSLIAVGGIDRALTVLDTRIMGIHSDLTNSKETTSSQSPIVWFKHNAHARGSLNAISWNPFVPYWLATASDDKSVSVWDLRFNSHPLARIDGHQSAVRSLAWSNSHCDVLTTGAEDCHWRLWNIKSDMLLYEDPTSKSSFPKSSFGLHGKSVLRKNNQLDQKPTTLTCPVPKNGYRQIGAQEIASCDNGVFASSVIGVASSNVWSNAYFAVSYTGELTCHVLGNSTLDDFAIHKFDDYHNVMEYDLEKFVHRRDMEGVAVQILEWSKLPQNDEKVHELSKLVQLSQFIKINNEWSLAKTTDTHDPLNDVHNAAFAKAMHKTSVLEKEDSYASHVFSSVQDPVDIISNVYYSVKFTANENVNPTEFMQPFDASLDLPHSHRMDTESVDTNVMTSIKMVETFQKELELYSYHIPDRQNQEKMYRPINELVMQQFANLNIRLSAMNVLELHHKGFIAVPEGNRTPGRLDTVSPNIIVEEDENSETSSNVLPVDMKFGKHAPEGQVLISEAIFELIPKILVALESDITSFSPDLLTKYVEICLEYDYLRGLEFGLSVVELFDKEEASTEVKPRFSKLIGLVHLLLFPTVYDDDANNRLSAVKGSHDSLLGRSYLLNVPRKSTLESNLKNPKQAIPMIKKHYQVQTVLNTFSNEAHEVSMNSSVRQAYLIAERIICEVAEQPNISIVVNRSILNAYLETTQYDNYFRVASDLVASYSRHDFAKAILKQMERQAFPKLKNTFDVYLTPNEIRTQKKIELEDFIKVLVQEVRLMFLVVKQQGLYGSSPSGDRQTENLVLLLANVHTMIMNNFSPLSQKFIRFVETASHQQERPNSLDSGRRRTDVESVKMHVKQLIDSLNEILTHHQHSQQPDPTDIGSTLKRMDTVKTVRTKASPTSQSQSGAHGWNHTFVVSEVTRLIQKLSEER